MSFWELEKEKSGIKETDARDWQIRFKTVFNSEGQMPQIIAWLANAKLVFRVKYGIFLSVSLSMCLAISLIISANPLPNQ